MLDGLNCVRKYEEALAKLATGKYDNKDTYVHDYDLDVYRTAKTHTLNGLHWGYPDGIVETLAGDGDNPATYATWVTPALKKHSLYGQNSRYQIVKYSEIKAIVEKGIRQKLRQAKKDAKDELEFLASWQKTAKRKFKRYLGATLRIDVGSKPNTLDFIVIKPERLKTRGMGTFLENIKKGEISLSRAALTALGRLPERSGLMCIEVFDGPIVAGMIHTPEFRGVPLEAISVNQTALDRQLRPIMTIEA